MKISITHLKAQISTLGYSVGPIIILLVASGVGLLNPRAFQDDDFIFLILYCGIVWLLIYGADPLRKAEANTPSDKERTTIRRN